MKESFPFFVSCFLELYEDWLLYNNEVENSCVTSTLFYLQQWSILNVRKRDTRIIIAGKCHDLLLPLPALFGAGDGAGVAVLRFK